MTLGLPRYLIEMGLKMIEESGVSERVLDLRRCFARIIDPDTPAAEREAARARLRSLLSRSEERPN